MATISEATSADLSGYTVAPTVNSQAATPPAYELEPTYNSMMRCPLPVLLQTTGDSQRQFYLGGKVPQNRFLSLQPTTNGAGSSTGTAEITNTAIIGPGGSSGTVVTNAAQQAIATSTLSPGSRFTSPLTMAKSFQLLSLAANAVCRVQLYGTTAAQLQDAARQLDIPPPAGTAQNIICDVVLDTLPLQWAFQNRTGSNGNVPQQPLIYVTITNLGLASATIALTVNYVGLETA